MYAFRKGGVGIRKIIVGVLLLVGIFMQSGCFWGHDFRSVNWGMSKEQVKAVEKDALISEQKDMLIYQSSFRGISFNLIYQFENDKLVLGKYEGYVTEEMAQEIMRALQGEYGGPTGAPERKFDAEYESQIVYWLTARSNIVLDKIKYKEGSIYHHLTYSDKKYFGEYNPE